MEIISAFVVMFLASGCLQSSPVKTNTVEINGQGFSPNAISVKAGDAVTFVNRDSTLHWPASGTHPSHNDYPEHGGCIGSAFDACKGLKAGESFAFTFNEKGTWHYHDHLNSGMEGTIIVE